MKNTNEYTDEELVLAYSRGNNRAFDELLARMQDKLFSYILFVVHNEDIANDLFQETFVKVIAKLQEGRYTDSGRFSAWVMRIAHNVVIDWFRDEKIRNAVDTHADNNLTDVSLQGILDSNIENRYVNDQVMIDVKRIMNRLPPVQREVVYMRYYRSMSFKEIAATTGVSLNTALGRMRYALMNMRRISKTYRIALQLD